MKAILLTIILFIMCGGVMGQKQEVALFTTAKFPNKLIRHIKKGALKTYNVKVRWVGRLSLPEKYDDSYFADDFTNELSNIIVSKKYSYNLGLTNVPLIAVKIDDEDFFVSIKHLHGRTDTIRSSIITDNLVADTYDYNQDVTNIAMHEIGHLMKLDHCENPYCLMIGYGHLSNNTLCYGCREKLKKR